MNSSVESTKSQTLAPAPTISQLVMATANLVSYANNLSANASHIQYRLFSYKQESTTAPSELSITEQTEMQLKNEGIVVALSQLLSVLENKLNQLDSTLNTISNTL